MIKKVLISFILLVIGFLAGILLFFPAYSVLSYIVVKSGFSYKQIKGNVFSIQVKNLENQFLKIDNIHIKNTFKTVKLQLDENNKIVIFPLSNTGKVKLSKLDLEKFIKNKNIKGIITANLKAYKNKNFLTFEGDLKAENIKAIFIKNLNLSAKITKEKNKNHITANITSAYISGQFNGYLILDIKNPQNLEIEGDFQGQYFGKPIKQHISRKLGNFL